MWGDASTGNAARYDPLRWSSAKTHLELIAELRSQSVESTRRPVIVATHDSRILYQTVTDALEAFTGWD